jgi:anti-sigma factor ChrR (cupin superfamily)
MRRALGQSLACNVSRGSPRAISGPMVSMLVRLVPSGKYPPHTHAGVEQVHLLDGELWIDDRKLHPGDYHRAEPGTGDKRVWSETGCACVLVTSTRDALT